MVLEDENDLHGGGAEAGKPYSKPQLLIYGGLPSITRHTSKGGMEDGGDKGNPDMT